MRLGPTLFIALAVLTVNGCAGGLPSSSAPTGQDGENRIEKWRFAFELSPEWTFAGITEADEVTYYLYTREMIVDRFHRPITGAITIAFQRIDSSWTIAEYSGALKSIVPLGWNIEEIYTHEDGRLSFEEGVLYLIRYSDSQRQEHTAYVVHAKNDDIGIQIVMDISSELFVEVREELDKTLNTLALLE